MCLMCLLPKVASRVRAPHLFCRSVRAAFDPRMFEKVLAKRNEEALESALRFAEDFSAGQYDPASSGFNQVGVGVKQLGHSLKWLMMLFSPNQGFGVG